MRGTLHVCPLSQLERVAATSGAGHLVSLLSPGADAAPRPAGIPPDRHLRLTLSDIALPREGLRVPDDTHVAALLEFVREWDLRRPLLLHCYAGVSRSTAAALVTLCALEPGRPEGALAATLRAASPTATPNPRLVAVADRLLGRGGRLIGAAVAIGRGADCFEGAPFSLQVG